MRELENIVTLFASRADKLKFRLLMADGAAKRTKKIDNSTHPFFSVYLSANHPLRNTKFQNTWMGTGGVARSFRELRGIQYAREFIESAEKITAEDIKKINYWVRGAKDSEPKLHNERRFLKDLNSEKVLFACADPKDFESALEYIAMQTNTNPQKLHPLHLAAMVHFLTVYTHPFPDGNGRTARILASYVIKKHGYKLYNSALDEYYNWDRVAYANATSFEGDFYQPENSKLKIEDWDTYFIKSIEKAFKSLFKTQMSTKVEIFKETKLGISAPLREAIIPVPEEIKLEINNRLIKIYGKPVAEWVYRNSEGRVMHYLVRFAGTRKNNFKKDYFIFQYYSNGRWYPGKFDMADKTVIYNLQNIDRSRKQIYVICEGEKSADAFNELMSGTEYVGVSWSKGAFRSYCTDWEPLHGADVIIWRDNDDAGKHAERDLCQILEEMDCKINIIKDEALAGKPPKWDVADAIADGATKEHLSSFLSRNFTGYN